MGRGGSEHDRGRQATRGRPLTELLDSCGRWLASTAEIEERLELISEREGNDRIYMAFKDLLSARAMQHSEPELAMTLAENALLEAMTITERHDDELHAGLSIRLRSHVGHPGPLPDLIAARRAAHASRRLAALPGVPAELRRLLDDRGLTVRDRLFVATVALALANSLDRSAELNSAVERAAESHRRELGIGEDIPVWALGRQEWLEAIGSYQPQGIVSATRAEAGAVPGLGIFLAPARAAQVITAHTAGEKDPVLTHELFHFLEPAPQDLPSDPGAAQLEVLISEGLTEARAARALGRDPADGLYPEWASALSGAFYLEPLANIPRGRRLCWLEEHHPSEAARLKRMDAGQNVVSQLVASSA